GAWLVHYEIGGQQLIDYWFYVHRRWVFDLVQQSRCCEAVPDVCAAVRCSAWLQPLTRPCKRNRPAKVGQAGGRPVMSWRRGCSYSPSDSLSVMARGSWSDVLGRGRPRMRTARPVAAGGAGR